MSEWQPKIHYSIDQLGWLLYVIKEGDSQSEFIAGDGNIRTVKHGAKPDGQLWLARFESLKQLKQLIEEAEKQGVQSPSADTIAGELTATKNHLKDMRQLVFSKNKETTK